MEAKVNASSLEHPSRICVKLADHLRNQDLWISSPKLQKLLLRNVMGSVYERWFRLEKKHLEEGIELSPEQIAKLEDYNPVLKAWHVESSRPGELLSLDMGYLKGIGKVYLHAVVGTFSSYAFGFLYNGKQAECAATLLHNDVLPFYTEQNLKINAILTDNCPEFCGTPQHPFEMYLALNQIAHRRTIVRRPRTNGFIERFNRTVLDEFFRVKFREKFHESVDSLQIDLDVWFRLFKTERPHRGYRIQGRTPLQSIQSY